MLAGTSAALAAGALSLPARALSRTEVAEDIAVLRSALAIHPGAGRYLTPAQLEAGFRWLERKWAVANGEGATGQRYLALSRFLATLRCGHSYANFFNQTDAPVKALFDRKTRLPFDFEWIGAEMVVTAGHDHAAALPPGTRIAAVNGVPAPRILATLLPFTRGDGHNDGKRRSLLGVRGAEEVETFDVFQGLLLPPLDGRQVLDAIRPEGTAVRLDLPAIGLAARQATMTRLSEDSALPRWTYAVRPDGIALLDMPGWAMWNSKWDWRAWLADRLDDAAGARGLIVDIRSNEGGDDCGDPIVARLIDRDVSGWPFVPRVRFREVPTALAPHVTTWDDSFRHIGAAGADLGGGWFGLPQERAPAPIRPDGKPIRVPVAALIGPANSSATFGFITSARASGRVRLFGGTTGGNRRGINGGAFFFTRLPASGIEFDLPLIGYFPRTPQPDAGIAPDVRVAATAGTIAAGADPVMAASADWIART